MMQHSLNFEAPQPASLRVERFDREAGEARRDTGHALALARASDQWKADAESVVQSWAPGTRFTADQVVEAVGLPSETGRNNAMGALLRRLALSGVIVGTTDYVKSRRLERQAGIQRVWERR